MTLHYDELEIDQDLPELILPPISRTTLALFAGASGDHNPIHIDLDFARAVGMSDVFAHGMLSMAYLGRLFLVWVAAVLLHFAITSADEDIFEVKIVEGVDKVGDHSA